VKLDVRAFAHSIGIVWAVAYTLCRVLFALAPGESMRYFGMVMHADLRPIMQPITWTGYFVGLAFVYGFGALAAGIAAWLYNRLRTEELILGAYEEDKSPSGYGPWAGGPAGHAGAR